MSSTFINFLFLKFLLHYFILFYIIDLSDVNEVPLSSSLNPAALTHYELCWPCLTESNSRSRIRPPWWHSLGLYRARQVAQIAINLWADLCRRPALASKIYRSPMTAAPKLAHGHSSISARSRLSVVPLSAVRSRERPLSADRPRSAFVSG